MPVLRGDELLVAVLGDADHHQQADAVVQPHVAVDAVDPPVDPALVAEVASAPGPMHLDPVLLEPLDGVGRQPLGHLAQRGSQGFLIVVRGDART